MKKNIKIIIKYLLLFLFFITILLLFGNDNTDNVWNYGVSHALVSGELPYRDYNTITTPLYQFIMSPLLLIYDSYLTFIIEQSILCVIFVYFVEKLVEKNIWLVLSMLLFPIYYFFFPNYNFLVMLLLILILYLEKEKKSDYLIGLVLGLLILSKHSVGGIVLIFSLISTKDIKRMSKRLLTALIPISIFLLYLLITGTLMNFIDLCILGLFDFAETNKYFSLLFTITTIIFTIYTIYSFIFKRDIINYYLIPAFTLLIPIVDMFHSTYFIAFFIIVIFMREKRINKKISIVLGITIIILTFISNVKTSEYIKNMTFSTDGKMKYVLLDKESNKYIKKILTKYNQYENTCMLSISSMYFDIESGKKITYFDIPLYGNFGYDGINKMKKKIDKMHDTYFFIIDNPNRQYVNILNDYVRKNEKYVENIENIEIYYKE